MYINKEYEELRAMKIEQIKDLVNGSCYDFLRTDERLGNRMVFLTISGSHAYGTNIDTSDVDIRGCALNTKSDLIGLTNFEQFTSRETDTTIYGFNKLISLLVNCNPNTIELLGCKPEHYIILTDIGEQLLENKKIFLSKRAADSFGGYATHQLHKLKNAVARDRLGHDEKEEHIKLAMERSIKSFANKFSVPAEKCIKLFTSRDSDKENLEIFCNINLEKYPTRELQALLNTLSSVVKNYEKLNHRNNKKDDAHLNKHAMHLIRLYLMCLDILEKEEIRTFRDEDIDRLLGIRNGEFQNKEDGTYKPEFFEMVSDFEKRLKYAQKNTGLPSSPNMSLIEDLVMSVNERSLYI